MFNEPNKAYHNDKTPIVSRALTTSPKKSQARAKHEQVHMRVRAKSKHYCVRLVWLNSTRSYSFLHHFIIFFNYAWCYPVWLIFLLACVFDVPYVLASLDKACKVSVVTL